MEFGVWKFMFNNVQYRLGGRRLLRIFPNTSPESLASNILQHIAKFSSKNLQELGIMTTLCSVHSRKPLNFNLSGVILYRQYYQLNEHTFAAAEDKLRKYIAGAVSFSWVVPLTTSICSFRNLAFRHFQ